MSRKLLDLVFERCSLRAPAKAVVVYLAHLSSDRGGAVHPSMETIGQAIGLSDRRARDAVHEAKEAGWIHLQGGGGRGLATEYTVNVDRLLQYELRNADESVLESPHQNPDESDVKADESVLESGENVRVFGSAANSDNIRNVLVSAPQQVMQPTVNTEETKVNDENPDVFVNSDDPVRPRTVKASNSNSRAQDEWPKPPAWLPASDWSDFCGMREALKRSKRTPWTPAIAAGSLRSLERLRREQQFDPVKVLRRSTESCWAGFFPKMDDRLHGAPDQGRLGFGGYSRQTTRAPSDYAISQQEES